MHRATVYRLLKRVRTEGETAYTDGRHGQPNRVRASLGLSRRRIPQEKKLISTPTE